MANCLTLESGSKIKYYFIPLIRGNCDKPPKVTITTSSATTANGGPATIAVTALPTGVAVPKGAWLDFVAPSVGKTVPVRLTADAVTGATSLAVENVPEAIATASTASLPPLLTARSSGNLNRTGESENVSLLETYWANSLTTGASWEVPTEGVYDQLSSAYRNAELCFETGNTGWVIIEFPSPNPLVYSTGAVYEGEVTVKDLPLDIPKGIVKGNISFAGTGALYKTEPKPIAAVV
jgi:hypothetical protein